jgi:hypothetical protein
LEERTVLSSVTVVTHGLVFAGTSGPMFELGAEIYEYWTTQGSAGGFGYDPATGDLQLLIGSKSGENKVIAFDWAAESDDLAAGYDEAAADALFAMLVANDLVDSDYLHLIGYSRGAIVVSEAAQRLLDHGYAVDQLTFLDQEPSPFPPYNAAGSALAWEGVGFVDNYFGDGEFGLQGEPVAGAHNVDLRIGDLGDVDGDGYVGHGEVHRWYQTTVNAPAATEGFHWRRDPASQASAPTQGDPTSLTPPPAIINGDFEYPPPTFEANVDFAGWFAQGGGGGGYVGSIAGNEFLILDAGDADRTHNRLFVPPDAAALAFDLWRTDPSGSDVLRVTLAGSVLANFALDQLDAGFVTRRVAVPAALRSQVGTPKFEIVKGGFFIDSQVRIDNVKFLGDDLLVAAPDAGPRPDGVSSWPLVKVFEAGSGAARFEIVPYPNFGGGVRVATGDINADGTPDVITAAGPGGGPHVRVFDGLTGLPLPGPIGSFFAYAPAFAGGVFVASGDVNGDGRDDIITGAGAGGGPHVRVFSGIDGVELFGFFAYESNFTGGVSVAAGDVDADGQADVVTGAGAGGGPHVRVFSGADRSELFGFFAYQPAFAGGVYVAAGDVNGDGRADIYTGAGAGGGPHVRVFSGADSSDLHGFFAYNAAFAGGVRVAAGDLDGDGRADILTSAGPGGGPHVRGFSGVDLEELTGFFAYPPGFSRGVFLAGSPTLAVQPLAEAQLNLIRAAVSDTQRLSTHLVDNLFAHW